MFVTAQDFDIPPYNLTNLDKLGSTFTTYVDRVEEEALRKVLGGSLYEQFKAGLAVTPIEDIEERWIKLRDGDTYTYNDRNYSWIGMKKLLIPYVYQSWIGDTYLSPSGIGLVLPNAENATVVSPNDRICRAYNQYSSYVGSSCNMGDTLYGYLVVRNQDDGAFDDTFDDTFGSFGEYLDFYFTPPGRKNTFDF
jgi:hypothetical protein